MLLFDHVYVADKDVCLLKRLVKKVDFFWWEEKRNKDLERIGRKRQNKVDTNIQIKSTDFIPKRKRDKHYHTHSHIIQLHVHHLE